MKNNKQLGIYIHIPFCVRKCDYCDFLSAPADERTKNAYMRALKAEIVYTAKRLQHKVQENFKNGGSLSDYSVKTVFFGGGTPSVVEPAAVGEVLETVFDCFFVDSGAEITLECNPGTLTQEKAKVYKQAGINRISFGLQTPDNRLLKILGRIHTYEDFLESLSIARNAGFDNLNVDLMSALPGQTLSGYVEGLRRVAELPLEHLSAYSLIQEEGTPMGEHPDRYPPLPDEEEEREMYHETKTLLESLGYRQYEISNFAKPQKQCRHNLAYWERKDYLGFGIGAASLFADVRSTNTSKLHAYIEYAGKTDLRENVEVLTKADCMEEFMFLGLRKTRGIRFDDFFKQFHADIRDIYGAVIEKNVAAGLLVYVQEETTGRKIGCRLTQKGTDISNCVMADFIF